MAKNSPDTTPSTTARPVSIDHQLAPSTLGGSDRNSTPRTPSTMAANPAQETPSPRMTMPTSTVSRTSDFFSVMPTAKFRLWNSRTTQTVPRIWASPPATA